MKTIRVSDEFHEKVMLAKFKSHSKKIEDLLVVRE